MRSFDCETTFFMAGSLKANEQSNNHKSGAIGRLSDSERFFRGRSMNKGISVGGRIFFTADT